MCPTNNDQRLRNMRHEELSNLNKDDPPVKDRTEQKFREAVFVKAAIQKFKNAGKKRHNPTFFVFCCHFILLLLVCSKKKHENIGDIAVVMKVISTTSARWQAQATFLCIGTTSLTRDSLHSFSVSALSITLAWFYIQHLMVSQTYVQSYDNICY